MSVAGFDPGIAVVFTRARGRLQVARDGELLVEAHARGETASGSSAYYVGFRGVPVIEHALR